MTFTENLKKAQSGDEYAYKLVCNEFAGGLYTVARLTLNTLEDAEAAVRNAFSDGFATIKQIKDHDHLRAWLAHELTKHMVACLKSYRDKGEPELELGEENSLVLPGLDHVESVYIIKARREIYGKLAGLDRLAASLHAVYGYDSREISIIIGLSEEATVRKLANAERVYSEFNISEQTLFNLVKRIKAPEKLCTPERPRSIPFDTINSDNKKIAFSDISEPVAAPVEQEEAPAATEQESVEEPVQEPEEAEQIKQEVPVEVHSEEIAQKVELEEAAQEIAQKEEAEQKEGPKNPPREIDAKMFIGIISAQHIKGGEFLRLMGNTRISNSAYREIEQNPKLTKERLITLLEESGLTTADYYKVLTAIKLQRDIDTASTRAFSPRELENMKASENAEVAPAKPPVLTPEHKPAPAPDLSVTTMLEEIPTEREEIPEPPLVLPRETPKAADAPVPDLSVTTMLGEFPTEREEMPESPLVLPHEVAKTADAPIPDISVTAMLGKIPTEREPTPAKPPVLTPEPKQNEADEKPYSPDESEISESPLVTQIGENEGREKYKSNEFFYDDDAYEPGVNNGKIAFCAVCAVLLLAGSFLCRYLTTGSLIPTDKPTENVAVEQKKTGISAEEIVTDEDVIAAVAKLTINERRNSLDEYYVGQTYESALSSDFCEVGDTMYIYNKGAIRAVELGDEPTLTVTVELKEKGEFIGFTADSEHIYALTQSENDENGRKAVVVEIFDNTLKLLGTYAQDGDFATIHENNGTLTIFTVLKSAGEENPLPTYSLDGENKTLTRSEIEIPNDIAYNGFTVFGTLNGTDVRTTAVLGGYDAYATGEGDSFTLIIPDYNKTYLRAYRVVGLTAELQAEETVDGELYGEECYNAENGVLVAYDSVEDCTKILKKTENSYDNIAKIGEGEVLKGTAFSDELTYIVTENADGAAVLYCCGADGTELTPDPEAVYSRRLSTYGDKLIGLSAQADENGARAGLRLSVYEYDKELTELYGTDISVDEKTSTEYTRYLSGDAEENSALIAQNGDYIAVSCVYFDGVSEIERFLCFKDNSGELENISDLLLFDIQSDYRYLTFREETLYIVTASTVVTADLSTGKATGYFQLTIE